MLIIPLNLDFVLLSLHNSKLAYYDAKANTQTSYFWRRRKRVRTGENIEFFLPLIS